MTTLKAPRSANCRGRDRNHQEVPMTVNRTPIPVSDTEAVVVLTRGKVALIDLEDATLVGAHTWHAYQNRDGSWYARANNPAGSRPASIRLHRVIMGLGPGRSPVVDHVNGDGLDNRKRNLRIASPSENGMNRGATRANASGYKGIYLHGQTGKWRPEIKAGEKRIRNLGLYHSPEDAAQAYDQAAIELHGEFAVLNFPADAEKGSGR